MKLEFGVPTDNSAPTIQFGLSRGIFQREGIELAVRPLYGGPALAAALDGGALKLALLGMPPALTALSTGSSFRIVGGGLKQQLQLYLGVRAGLGIAGLRGGRLGLLSLGSCDEWIARLILAKHGLDPDRDVSFVALGSKYSRLVDLIHDREIDAAMAIEPHLSIGEARGVLTVEAAAFESPYLPRFQWTVIAAGAAVREEEPELIHGFLRAYAVSAQDAVANIDLYIDIVAEAWRLDREIVARGVHRESGRYCLDGSIDLAGMAKAIAIQEELGTLARPIEAEDVLDRRFVPGFS